MVYLIKVIKKYISISIELTKNISERRNGTILHPWQRDTGKYAAQGPNIMSPEAPLMPPEARRAELEGRGQHHGGRGRHNVAQGRHIFQWHKARGVLLTLLYRQADIDTGILTVVKSNMQTCTPPCSTDFKKFQILPWQGKFREIDMCISSCLNVRLFRPCTRSILPPHFTLPHPLYLKHTILVYLKL